MSTTQPDSKPSAPQAESVPSGKDAAHKWLDAKVGRPFSERHAFTDHNGRMWNLATLLSEYAAAAERSNSLLRERLNAAIRLFGEIETIDQPYLVFERDFWKRITDFAAQKENQ